MPICEFSTDDWRSDVAVYQTPNGFAINVAASRPVGVVPRTPELNLDTLKDRSYIRSLRVQLKFLQSCQREAVGLEYDGKIIEASDHEDLISKLGKIKRAGYRVPGFMFYRGSQVAA